MNRGFSRFCLLSIVVLVVFATAVELGHQPSSTARASAGQSTSPEGQPPPATAEPQVKAQPDAALADTPISNWEYDQVLPAAAYNGHTQEYLVVWEDHHWGWGDDWDINGRRVGLDGTPLGGQIAISWDGAEHRLAPDLAVNTANGEYLVVWEYAFEETDHDIYARRLSSDGSLPGVEIPIAIGRQNESLPAVAYNPASGEYLIVWASREGLDEFAQLDVRAQRLSAGGTLLGSNFAVASTSLDETAPAVAYNAGNNEFLVVWQGKQPYTTHFGIYGQRVAANGSLPGGQIAISTWEGDQLKPRLAYDQSSNRFLVVWEDHHWGTDSDWSIYGQLVNANGSLFDTHLLISGGSPKNRLNPDVVFKPSARSYLVAWQYQYFDIDHDLRMRRVAFDGSRPEAEQIITSAFEYQGSPAVAAGPEAAILVAWEDGRNRSASGSDVYGAALSVTVPALEGTVYEGEKGVSTEPLPGVTVDLYCSKDEGSLGSLLASSVTSRQGAYVLPAYALCEYYHIVETDPHGYVSSGSSTVSGTPVTPNWTRYTYPLTGKVLTGNNFWDYEPGPVDQTPPGNWGNFQPASWVNAHSVTCAIQVVDTQTGLDVASAQVAYTLDGGASWTPWQSAACSGSSGTTETQTITASGVPFERDSSTPGHNQCKFAIADLAGNRGESSGYNVLIDTVPPENPTSITCPAHPAGFWVHVGQVTCQWAGASDALSGVDGYTIDWDHLPGKVPDLPVETSATDVSLPLSDSSDWYLHVRSVDRAGNGASGAAHYGPIKIDTGAPTAWLTAPASGSLNVPTFAVSWAAGDTLSGVAHYDVQTSTNGAAWTNWQEGVSHQSALFAGKPGQTIQFRVHAQDHAGNWSPWSSVVQVTIGVPVTVRVRNESGALLQGAKVYYDGKFAGLTNAGGLLTIPYAVLGDSLVATYLVHEEQAPRAGHGWSWRVYHTSVGIPSDGTPQLFSISNTGAAYQDLTVRKDQTIVGFHVLVWVEWDANSAYLAGVTQGLKGASAYLYDATDGQLFWELVEIYDDGQNGPAGDMNIYANTQVWPNAFVDAITSPTSGRIYLPREWAGGPWSSSDAWRTMIHEFGHYGLALYDEYKDREGKGGGFCTHNRGPGSDMVDEPTRASIMDSQHNASEFCSLADPNHLHNTNTEHDAMTNGETTWETIMRKYSDPQTPSRWTLQSPDTRHVPVVAGPTSIPVPDWVSVVAHDSDTHACAPFTQTVFDIASGTPVVGAELTLERPSRPNIIQGLTNWGGQLVILGAHNGDTLRSVKGTTSGQWTVSCSPTASGGSAAATASGGMSPDPFTLAADVAPLGATQVQVQVRASVALASAPAVSLWQGMAIEPVSVSMTYNSQLGAYTGTAALDQRLEREGHVVVAAANSTGGTVWRQQAFAILPMASPHPLTHLYSADSNFELVLPAGALDAGAFLSIQPTDAGSAALGALLQVGSAYQVIVSNGQVHPALPVVVNMRFQNLQEVGVHPESLRLYRWDGAQERWLPAGNSLVDLSSSLVSTRVEQLGVFALLGSPTSGQPIYLPLVVR